MINEVELLKLVAKEKNDAKVLKIIRENYNITLLVSFVKNQRRNFKYSYEVKHKKLLSKAKVAEIEGDAKKLLGGEPLLQVLNNDKPILTSIVTLN